MLGSRGNGGEGTFMANDSKDAGAADATSVTASLNERELYWMSLGRFIAQFSLVETLLLMLLAFLAKIEPHVGPAILSGTRMDTAKDYIKRLLEAKPDARINMVELNDVFARLTLITRIRNDLLHHGVKEDQVSGLITSNALTPP